MTPRTALSIILLSLIFPAQEIWQLWRESSRNVNWWIALDYPLNIQWYIKMLGELISKCLMALVIYRITFKIEALRKAAIVLLTYTLIELLFFFINFNRTSYALVFSTVGLVVMITIYWRGVKKFLSFKHKNQFQ